MDAKRAKNFKDAIGTLLASHGVSAIQVGGKVIDFSKRKKRGKNVS